MQVKSQNFLVELQKVDSGQARISVIQDESIATLLLSRINEISNQYKIEGFRINIFSDDSRDSRQKAMQVRTRFLSRYSYNVEYIYEAPDSKLYVGNFRTKSEAQKVLNIIQGDFPKAFIKPDKIHLPDLE